MIPDAPRIAGIGSYLPEARVQNAPLLATFGMDRQFMVEKLGVVSRAIRREGMTDLEMCERAFADLVQRVPIRTEDIGLVVAVTQTPDAEIPHLSARLHDRLKLGRCCMTFDISQGCAGYLYGLKTVGALIRDTLIGEALLFTCDPYSSRIDPDDRSTALLFGDAATVTLIRRAGPGLELTASGFGMAPGSSDCLSRQGRFLRMDGQRVFNFAAREVPSAILSLLDQRSLTLRTIDGVLLHQASRYVVEFIRNRLGLDTEKVPFEACSYGNTVSSSLPLLLASRLANANLKTIVLSGFGIGFSWATGILERRSDED